MQIRAHEIIEQHLEPITDRRFDDDQMPKLAEHVTLINGALKGAYLNLEAYAQEGRVELFEHPRLVDPTTDRPLLVPEEHLLHEERLWNAGVALQEKINSPENCAIAEELKKKLEDGDKWAERFLGAHPGYENDEATKMLIRIGARLAMYNEPESFVKDVDNFQNIDKAAVYMATTIGADRSEHYLELSRDNFAGALPREWGPALERYPETFASAGRVNELPIRPGTSKFLSVVKQNGCKVNVLSAGLEPRTKGTLKKIASMEGQSLEAMYDEVRTIRKDSVNANYKTWDSIDLACSNFQRPSVFGGEGTTDLPMLRREASDIYAYELTIKDSKLHRGLIAENTLRELRGEPTIPFIAVEDHFESLDKVTDTWYWRDELKAFMEAHNDKNEEMMYV